MPKFVLEPSCEKFSNILNSYQGTLLMRDAWDEVPIFTSIGHRMKKTSFDPLALAIGALNVVSNKILLVYGSPSSSHVEQALEKPPKS